MTSMVKAVSSRTAWYATASCTATNIANRGRLNILTLAVPLFAFDCVGCWHGRSRTTENKVSAQEESETCLEFIVRILRLSEQRSQSSGTNARQVLLCSEIFHSVPANVAKQTTNVMCCQSQLKRFLGFYINPKNQSWGKGKLLLTHADKNMVLEVLFYFFVAYTRKCVRFVDPECWCLLSFRCALYFLASTNIAKH